LSVTNRIELLLYFATCLSDSGSTKASKGLNLPLPCCVMKDLLILLTRLLTTIAKSPGTGWCEDPRRRRACS
jgi:hypothetical protein